MKINKSQKDTRTTHDFDLAGMPATIRVDEYDHELGVAITCVTVGGQGPVPCCFFGTVIKNEIRDRLRDLRAAKKMGILRPLVKPGDIVEAGPGHNLNQGVQVLCLLAGLDPDDCTDYDYVDLSVRAAAMALARKITLLARRKKATRPSAPFTSLPPSQT
jgi:hypothetical protein